VHLPLKDVEAFSTLPLTSRDELSLWKPDNSGRPVF
jgi:hypothetical protein